MLLLLQVSPLAFAVLAGIRGLLVGSFGSDLTRKRVFSLYRNCHHD